MLTQPAKRGKERNLFNPLSGKGYSYLKMPVTEDLTRRISSARAAVFDVLQAVEEGAYASDALRERSRALTPRDVGLASQIAFGTLRYQAQLDYLIALYSGRAPAQLDRAVLLALRSAIFQLRYLERVPPHAAVHEAVEFVKIRKRAAAGLTNAVLRKVTRDPVRWPGRAAELSCPPWLLHRWDSHFGPEEAKAIARHALIEPQAYIRVPSSQEPPAGTDLAPTDVPGCFRVLSPIASNQRLHDISSQAVLPLLDLRAGQTYLDLCAAPGNKTLQALERAPRLAIACDISARRIAAIPPVCPRVVLDATAPLPFGQKFDRIFIDAPCSGTGTLSRNPEIKWRLTEPDLLRFQSKQIAILRQALPNLAPEGKLLYATCSLEREENEAVIENALAENQDLVCRTQWRRVPGRDEGDGFFAALLQFRE